MAEPRNRIRRLTDSLGLEIDRLIKTLPGADPKLRGEPEPAPISSPTGSTRAVGAGFGTGTSAGIGAVTAGPSPSESAATNAARARRNEFFGVWGRVFGAVVLATAVMSWPYSHACGWRLDIYLAVVSAVLLSGAWASWAAWRAQSAAAHVIGLVVFYWGIVLAAEQVLPRIGYAAAEAVWRCGS